MYRTNQNHRTTKKRLSLRQGILSETWATRRVASKKMICHHYTCVYIQMHSLRWRDAIYLLSNLCYDSLSLPPLHFIFIGYTFPILFKSPFSISINKLFYFQAFYYSAFYYSAFHYSAFLLFSLILLSLFIIQLYYSATFLLV